MDSDSQVMNACRALVRLAARRGMKINDRFPPQNELLELTGFCNNTLTPAFRLLGEAGFLDNRRKVGRALLAEHAVPDELWRVAIPYGPPDDRPGGQFSAVMLCFLQNQLQSLGCRCVCYPRLPEHASSGVHRLDHFAKLAEAVRCGRIDGMITSALFDAETIQGCAARGISVCHIGSDETYPIRLEFDDRGLLESAMQNFHAKGARRPLLVVCDETASLRGKRLRNRFAELAAEYGMVLDDSSFLTDSVVGLLRRAGEEFRTEGHDSVLILNDVAGSAFSMSLAAGASRPLVAVQTNRQIPLAYAVPIIRYEYDVEQLAARAVEKLLRCIRYSQQEMVSVLHFTEKDAV